MKLHRIVAYTSKAPIGWMHWCPGCEEPHAIYVEQPNPSTGARWSFNGDTANPDFNPSILVFSEANGVRRTHCHYFLHAGQLQFCGDSPHRLSGQTVPLPDFPPSYLGETPTMAPTPRRAVVKTALKVIAFYPPITTVHPKREISAIVTKVHGDGTVNVIAGAEGEIATPYERVPLIAAGAAHPANGPFAVDMAPGTVNEAAPAKPARKRKPATALKRKLPPKKAAKK